MQTSRQCSARRRSASCFLLFLDLKDLAALVVAAVRADRVRQAHGAAVRACHQVVGLQRVVRPAAVTATLGVLALGMWRHSTLLYVRRTGAGPSLIPIPKQQDYTGAVKWRQV